MREILFRGKAINREEGREYRTNYKNGDWVYGLVSEINKYCGVVTMTNEYGVSNIDIDPETIGQYTGITAKYKKRIFEGDIVEIDFGSCKSKPLVVKYGIYREETNGWGDSCILGFYLDDGEDQLNPLDFQIREKGFMYPNDILQCKSKIKVIGNIYDNPELLKGE